MEQDMLRDIFTLQEQLNDRIFDKQVIAVEDRVLRTEDFRTEQAQTPQLGPNTLTNQWLRNYLKALQEEGKELEAELLWKWWSKDNLDMQNIRVEIVDMMHFLISLALAAGLDAKEFHRLYTAKHRVNEQRQDQGYSKETKNEADNKGVV